jgi:hypothetical protein
MPPSGVQPVTAHWFTPVDCLGERRASEEAGSSPSLCAGRAPASGFRRADDRREYDDRDTSRRSALVGPVVIGVGVIDE